MEDSKVQCKFQSWKTGKIHYIQIIKLGESWNYFDFLLALAIQNDMAVDDIEYIGDAAGIEIPEEYFLDIFFERFRRVHFILTIKLKDEVAAALTPMLIAAQNNGEVGLRKFMSLEERFIREQINSHGRLLKNRKPIQHEDLPDLSDIEKQAIVEKAANMFIEKFPHQPELEQKTTLVNAINKLFPQLKPNQPQNAANKSATFKQHKANNPVNDPPLIKQSKLIHDLIKFYEHGNLK